MIAASARPILRPEQNPPTQSFGGMYFVTWRAVE